MKIIAVILSRMGSNRLPGKALLKINNIPAIIYIYKRVLASKSIDDVVIATTNNKQDDSIEELCKKEKILCYRGPEDDVLKRLVLALQKYKANVGVIIYGDCPLIDPNIISQVVNVYKDNIEYYDFVSNDLKTTFPPGMEVEVVSLEALKKANSSIINPSIREHGTLHIRKNPEIFRLLNVEAPEKYNFPNIEIELDTIEDYSVIDKIARNFTDYNYDLEKILSFLEVNPSICDLNKNIPRKWKKFRNN
jgi:spore coat polysaccharide biosynthesis protein SpsF (cytidylyltransferase family)